jgi:hypothetical protein
MGTQDSAKGAMGRVGKIGIPVHFIFEGDKEAMSVAIRFAFDADIGAPFKGVDGVDLARQGAEGGFDLAGLFRGGVVFEFEENNMA